MPRKARARNSDAIYHIICRSSSEILLFRNDQDKDHYLGLLKTYTEKHKCVIYAYCLMDNHVHLHFDARGCDISKFMQSLNTAYVRYYNNKPKRHGHLFQGRFESRILDTDQYNLTVSAYIHNNPKGIEGYSGEEEKFKYSSYGIYLGKRKDTYKLIDKGFIMGYFDTKDEAKFRENYFSFVSFQRDVGGFSEINNKLSCLVENEYKSGRKILLRNLSPEEVISYISNKLLIPNKTGLLSKGSKKFREFKAFCAYALNSLCGLGYREICNSIHNITISGCSILCNRGFELCQNNDLEYSSLFNDLANCKA